MSQSIIIGPYRGAAIRLIRNVLLALYTIAIATAISNGLEPLPEVRRAANEIPQALPEYKPIWFAMQFQIKNSDRVSPALRLLDSSSQQAIAPFGIEMLCWDPLSSIQIFGESFSPPTFINLKSCDVVISRYDQFGDVPDAQLLWYTFDSKGNVDRIRCANEGRNIELCLRWTQDDRGSNIDRISGVLSPGLIDSLLHPNAKNVDFERDLISSEVDSQFGTVTTHLTGSYIQEVVADVSFDEAGRLLGVLPRPGGSFLCESPLGAGVRICRDGKGQIQSLETLCSHGQMSEMLSCVRADDDRITHLEYFCLEPGSGACRFDDSLAGNPTSTVKWSCNLLYDTYGIFPSMAFCETVRSVNTSRYIVEFDKSSRPTSVSNFETFSIRKYQYEIPGKVICTEMRPTVAGQMINEVRNKFDGNGNIIDFIRGCNYQDYNSENRPVDLRKDCFFASGWKAEIIAR